MVADKNMVRKAIESMYDCLATIIEYRAIKDDKTKLTSMQEVTVYEEQPCRISIESIVNVEETKTTAKLTQKVKLFLAPEPEIKPNSKIVIKKNQKSAVYTNSSAPNVYDTHQEIMLSAFERWV